MFFDIVMRGVFDCLLVYFSGCVIGFGVMFIVICFKFVFGIVIYIWGVCLFECILKVMLSVERWGVKTSGKVIGSMLRLLFRIKVN